MIKLVQRGNELVEVKYPVSNSTKCCACPTNQENPLHVSMNVFELNMLTCCACITDQQNPVHIYLMNVSKLKKFTCNVCPTDPTIIVRCTCIHFMNVFKQKMHTDLKNVCSQKQLIKHT